MDNNRQLLKDTERKSRLDLIPEQVLNNKELLMEVSIAGYDPLDPDDVKNFLEKLPPKNLERNIIISGAYEGQNLGMSKASEDDIAMFTHDNPDVEIRVKKTKDTYFSELPKTTIDEYGESDFDMDNLNESTYVPPKTEKRREGTGNSIDNHRTNLSKVFGADDIKIVQKEIQSISSEIVQHDSRIEKVLELIKELKALGFNSEEIKKEIKLIIK